MRATKNKFVKSNNLQNDKSALFALHSVPKINRNQHLHEFADPMDNHRKTRASGKNRRPFYLRYIDYS